MIEAPPSLPPPAADPGDDRAPEGGRESRLRRLASKLGIARIGRALGERDAIETRLRQALDELARNQKRLLTLQDLGRRVSDAGSEQAVLEVAARAPLVLADAQASSVVTFDSEHQRLALGMAWGLSERYLAALRRRIDEGIPTERCQACAALRARTGGDCPLLLGLEETIRAEGIRSLCCLPMLRDQERIGMIAAYFPNPEGAPESQIRLLSILSGSIAAALDGLQLRSRSLAAVGHLAEAPRGDGEIAPAAVARQVLELTAQGWRAEAAGLLLFDSEAQSWSCDAQRDLGPGPGAPRFDLALEMAQQAQSAGRPVRLSPLPGAGKLAGSRANGLNSAVAAPLFAEGRVFGALFLASPRRGAFEERHLELLDAVAQQVALAVRNAQLYERLNRMAVIEERYRLSREIHDGLAQTVSYLALSAERLQQRLEHEGAAPQAVAEAAEIKRSIRAAYVDVREAIDGLRLSVAEPGRLSCRLAEYVSEFARQSGIEANFASEPAELATDPEIGLQLLRITQEALTNIRKHAEAHRASVRLRALKDGLELVIADDGRGLAAAQETEDEGRRHYGLATMRERAASLQGALTIASGPGQGTRITVQVPGSAAA